MRRTLRSTWVVSAGVGLAAGLLAAPGPVAASAADKPQTFTGLLRESLAAAKGGIRKSCHTNDTESMGVPAQYRAEVIRGRWVWLIAYDQRSDTGEFSTIAGRDLSRYTQFTKPISRKGRAKLRRVGRPDALGLRAPLFGSVAHWRDALFDADGDLPQQLAPHVWGLTGMWPARWRESGGVLVEHWVDGVPIEEWGCTYSYRDVKVPALGDQSRYLRRRWQNRHSFLPGKNLPLDSWQYQGKMR